MIWFIDFGRCFLSFMGTRCQFHKSFNAGVYFIGVKRQKYILALKHQFFWQQILNNMLPTKAFLLPILAFYSPISAFYSPILAFLMPNLYYEIELWKRIKYFGVLKYKFERFYFMKLNSELHSSARTVVKTGQVYLSGMLC